MAKYTCRIEADKSLYPVLLSNGNLAEHGDLEVMSACLARGIVSSLCFFPFPFGVDYLTVISP